ncbi:MAG TPA: shikimate dehydrogenase [Opitutaceae bacterium]|nr:shikimate dehydrogenase [Opitutaceae bacterium]
MSLTLPPKDVYTLADLATWPSGRGTWLAVLGQPIKHSLSPGMHGAALREMAAENARFRDWRYVRFEVSPEDLPAALTAFHAKGFLGLNLTVPHKIIAVPHVAKIDEKTRRIGAVNTLRRTTKGWEGFNTDGYGLVNGMAADLGAKLRDADVILLGAGGAARGAAVECLEQGCRSLWIGNRTPENLQSLIALLQPLAGKTTIYGFDLAKPPRELPRSAWVINATSAGLKPTDPRPIELAKIPKPSGVYDMIYNPAETLLLGDARRIRVPAANGLSMLVHQGARALEIWSERAVPVAAMEKSVKNALGR